MKTIRNLHSSYCQIVLKLLFQLSLNINTVNYGPRVMKLCREVYDLLVLLKNVASQFKLKKNFFFFLYVLGELKDEQITIPLIFNLKIFLYGILCARD